MSTTWKLQHPPSRSSAVHSQQWKPFLGSPYPYDENRCAAIPSPFEGESGPHECLRCPFRRGSAILVDNHPVWADGWKGQLLVTQLEALDPQKRERSEPSGYINHWWPMAKTERAGFLAHGCRGWGVGGWGWGTALRRRTEESGPNPPSQVVPLRLCVPRASWSLTLSSQSCLHCLWGCSFSLHSGILQDLLSAAW